MLGYHGYGTNAYGSTRENRGPITRLAMRIIGSGYGIVNALMLRFRSLTLSNPETNERTLEL